jgi:hypothetical protein
MQEEIKKMFMREYPVNKTFSVKLVLGNLSKDQLKALNDLLDEVESEGIECVSYEEEND